MAMAAVEEGGSIERASSPSKYIGELPPKEHTAVGFHRDLKNFFAGEVAPHVKEYYDKNASGGNHSHNDRTVTIHNTQSGEVLTIGAKVCTKVQEIREMLGFMLQADAGKIEIRRATAHGAIKQSDVEEVASVVSVSGIEAWGRSRKRQYDHPICVLGAGLGGMQTMIMLQDGGRKDIVCLEKHADFGGHSWITVANRFTKLQTERGTYHVDFIVPGKPVPKVIAGEPYKTWPTRDSLLRMFRENAKEHGLYEKTIFNTSLERVLPKQGAYALQHLPTNEEQGDGGIMVTSALLAWPGNLIVKNEIEFPGEDDFGGYIEYSSFDKVDYMSCGRKNCILYGHGAFVIENVRTLVEHKCTKVFVLCRRRNLCGMKVGSWMVGLSEMAVPGNVMLEVFQVMYDLVGFDVWSAHSVTTDANRTFAQITQKTVFGVTDVYFLAGYYGLMEVVVDEIKRLTHHCAHTKKMRKIECEVIIKAIGTYPSFKVDKTLGIKELVGLWVNGDPLRAVSCNGMFVQARNFGSFSSGPGFTGIVRMFTWFVDYPEDWLRVAAALPHNKPGDQPAYVPGSSFFLPMFMVIGSSLPELQKELDIMNSLKAIKQKETHPMPEFLAECKAEWDAYVKFFKEESMVDDRPSPPYPYTEESVRGFIDKANFIAFSAAAARGR